MKGERRLSRTIALETLYEVDLVGHPPVVVLHERCGAVEDVNARVESYVRRLVMGILKCRGHLDRYIQAHAPEWPLDQVAVVDRNLLRMALYEFTVGDVPVKVAINEAVELAKLYGSDSSSRFVNGVLGALVSQQDEVKETLSEVVQS
jgi:N utilization substance protein B